MLFCTSACMVSHDNTLISTFKFQIVHNVRHLLTKKWTHFQFCLFGLAILGVWKVVDLLRMIKLPVTGRKFYYLQQIFDDCRAITASGSIDEWIVVSGRASEQSIANILQQALHASTMITVQILAWQKKRSIEKTKNNVSWELLTTLPDCALDALELGRRGIGIGQYNMERVQNQAGKLFLLFTDHWIEYFVLHIIGVWLFGDALDIVLGPCLLTIAARRLIAGENSWHFILSTGATIVVVHIVQAVLVLRLTTALVPILVGSEPQLFPVVDCILFEAHVDFREECNVSSPSSSTARTETQLVLFHEPLAQTIVHGLDEQVLVVTKSAHAQLLLVVHFHAHLSNYVCVGWLLKNFVA